MKALKLTYTVKDLSGAVDTRVYCDLLNDEISFFEVTDLVKSDLKTYNDFIDKVMPLSLLDYLEQGVDSDGKSFVTFDIMTWKADGKYDELSSVHKGMYSKFYDLITKNI